MQDEYTARLRKSIYLLCFYLLLTWGFVIYLMWMTGRQEKYIDTLKSELYSSSSSSNSENESQSSSDIFVYI